MERLFRDCNISRRIWRSNTLEKRAEPAAGIPYDASFEKPTFRLHKIRGRR